jgi:hypothetical protein
MPRIKEFPESGAEAKKFLGNSSTTPHGVAAYYRMNKR